MVAGGRNAERTARIANELGVPWRVLDFARSRNEHERRRYLDGISVCLNAAGPFEFTARKVAQACVSTRTHYVDLSGELDAIRTVAAFDMAARDAGVLLLPAAGYAVAPTDCAVATLLGDDPSIRDIEIYLTRFTVYSRGSARTMMNMVRNEVATFQGGEARSAAIGELTTSYDFGEGSVSCTAINWPDVATAPLTAEARGHRLRNMAVYLEADAAEQWLYAASSAASGWLNQPLVRATVDAAQTTLLPDGPPDETLRRLRRHIAVVGIRGDGQRKAISLHTRDPYTLTTEIALWILQQLPQLGPGVSGMQTPGSLFGRRLLNAIDLS